MTKTKLQNTEAGRLTADIMVEIDKKVCMDGTKEIRGIINTAILKVLSKRFNPAKTGGK